MTIRWPHFWRRRPRANWPRKGLTRGRKAASRRHRVGRQGIPVWDNRAIRIPAQAAPGDYRLWVVLYRIVNGSGEIMRLPVSGADVTGEGTVGVLPFVLHVR